MKKLEAKLRRQIAEGPEAAPVDPREVVEASAEDPWLQTLVALSSDAGLWAAWARAMEFGELQAAGRIAWVQAALEEVDEGVDAALQTDGAGPMAETLARAGVPWRHAGLAELLDEDDWRAAAALTLGAGDPEALRAWVGEAEVVDDIVEALRGAGLSGAQSLWELFMIWRMRLAELEADDAAEADETDKASQSAVARLDGVGATLDPTLFARGVLAGDYALDWLQEGEAVADFLQAYGPTDWLEPLALVTHSGHRAAEFAGLLAVAAADGIGEASPEEDEIEALMELLAVEPPERDEEAASSEADGDGAPGWEAQAAELGFGFQVALGEGGFGLLLSQVAAHERLVTWGIHSPGVPGLPLSATAEGDVDTSAVYWLIGEIAGSEEQLSDEAVVVAVRTLCDAAVWLRRDPEGYRDVCRQMVDMFEETRIDAIANARDRLRMELDAEFRERQFESCEEDAEDGDDGEVALWKALVVGGREQAPSAAHAALRRAAARRQDVVGLEAMRLLGQSASPSALRALGELWVDRAPVYRASFARSALEEALVQVSPPSQGGD